MNNIKIFYIVFFAFVLLVLVAVFLVTKKEEISTDNQIIETSSITTINDTKSSEEINIPNEFKNRPFNILLLGLDIGSERRAKGQRGANADTIMVLSVYPEKKKAMFVSIPRDLWTGKSKINAVLSTGGVDGMKERISNIIGMPVESYVSVDFDGLRWLIDYFGGVEVDVENTFTDSQFPNINDSGILTVSFNKGKEIMNGDRALTYARSRKGDNGEGSDLKRAKRQHQILKGVLGSISKPQNLKPFNPQEFYNEVIMNSNTDITLEGGIYMYSFYNLQEEYQIESLILDERYIYHPTDASPYGGAWVFVSKDPNFENLKNDIMTFFERS